MIVVNNEKRLISIPAPKGRIHLAPGGNEVDPVEWAVAVKHPRVEHMIEEEMIKPLDITSLRDLKDRAAIKLIAETNKLDLLAKWADSEEREDVKNALRAQVGKLTRAVEDAKRGRGK